MPSTARRLPVDWLDRDDPVGDPWLLVGDDPDAPGWRDACIGNGLIGGRVDPDGAGDGFAPGSASFRHDLWGAARENPRRLQGLIELPRWASLAVGDGERDLRRGDRRRLAYRQELDLRTATVTTRQRLLGSHGEVVIERRIWLCRQVPQLAVIEVEVGRPAGGMVVLDEVLECLDWPDLGTATSRDDGGDLVLEATSTRFGRRVAVRSRWLGIDPAATRVLPREAWARRRHERWVEPGGTLRMTKIVAITCDRDAADPDAFGRRLLDAHAGDLPALRAGHEAAWAALWRHRIEVPHRRLQCLANVAMYHHLIALRPGLDASHGPCGLAGNGWDGLVFWDTDTWTLPVYALFQPAMARGLVAYRARTLPGAETEAAARGEQGARWAWMSGEDGRECCSIPVFQNERHIVSSVALAQWHYARASGDAAWLTGPGRAIIEASARFWAARAEANPDGSWSIRRTCGPDEDAGEVDDNALTNTGAAWTLRRTAALVEAAGGTPPPAWRRIADGLRLPWNEARGIPLQMAGWRHGQEIKQADAVLMVHPWQRPFPVDTVRAMTDYYRAHYPAKPIMMARTIDGILDCRTGRPERAWAELGALCEHHCLPYLTVSESPTNERLPFLTGYGGLLQLLVHGFAGLAWGEDGHAWSPSLPPALPWIRLHGVHDAGRAEVVTCHADGRVERAALPPG